MSFESLTKCDIIYANDNGFAYDAAKVFQSEFYKKTGIQLDIRNNQNIGNRPIIQIGLLPTEENSIALDDNAWCAIVEASSLKIVSGHESLLQTAVSAFIASLSDDIKNEDFISGCSGVVNSFAPNKQLNGKSYDLVWNDEFNGNGLNSDYWSLKTGSFGNTWGTPKDCVYLDNEETCSVVDGKLSLSAISYTSPKDSRIKYAYPHTLTTEKSMSYKYGYLEMYAKLPHIQGLWASLWLSSGSAIGADNSTYSTEIDCFETTSVGKLTPNLHKWYSASDVAYNSSNTSIYHDNTSSSLKVRSGSYNDNEYHLYGFEWTPEKLVMYIDNREYMTFDLTKDYENYSKTGNDSSFGMNGFRNPMAILIGSSIYSNQYTIDNSWARDYVLNDNSALPLTTEIDWIRLYQVDSDIINRD